MVDAQPADNGNQKGARGSNFFFGGLLPANEGFLQHVLGVGYSAQHPVSNREQKATMLIEGGKPDRACCIGCFGLACAGVDVPLHSRDSNLDLDRTVNVLQQTALSPSQ
jgi:hypothetical protein